MSLKRKTNFFISLPKQPFVDETQQYRLVQPNCNGSGDIYNLPKVTHTNIYTGSSDTNSINGENFVSFTGANNNINMNGQMHYNLMNYPSTSNGINHHDIRFQRNHHDHVGVVVSTPRVYTSYPNPNPSTSWASSGSRQRLSTRPAWSGNRTNSGGVKKPKRIRTAFTSQQMMELETEYARARYLDRSRRIELSEVLNLNERTVKIWFQNRRMKEKKDKTETAEEAEATSTTEPTPAVASPVIMYDPYPHNGVYSREVYVEQYPEVSAAMPLSPQNNIIPLVQNGHNAAFNQYPTFIVDNNVQMGENFDMQYREVNMNLAECQISDKADDSKIEVINSSPQPGTSSNTSDASTNDFNGQNWDLSWIRSINMEDDF